MGTLNRLLQPLRSAASAFFKHDLTVKREGASVRLALKEREPGRSSRSSRSEAAQRREQEELTAIRTELAALLNQLPTTRKTMRHLVFVEQALAKKGLRALHKVPLDVLQRALEQLEGLVTNWSPVGLANLRSKMAVAIIDREHDNAADEGDAYRTAAVLEPGAVRAAGGMPQAAGPVTRPVADEAADPSEEEALAAAYAALGALAPAAPGVEVTLDLPASSPAAGARRSSDAAHAGARSAEIDVRVLQP